MWRYPRSGERGDGKFLSPARLAAQILAGPGGFALVVAVPPRVPTELFRTQPRPISGWNHRFDLTPLQAGTAGQGPHGESIIADGRREARALQANDIVGPFRAKAIVKKCLTTARGSTTAFPGRRGDHSTAQGRAVVETPARWRGRRRTQRKVGSFHGECSAKSQDSTEKARDWAGLTRLSIDSWTAWKRKCPTETGAWQQHSVRGGVLA